MPELHSHPRIQGVRVPIVKGERNLTGINSGHKRVTSVEYLTPFPQPTEKRKRLPNACLCTWAHSPAMGGKETPFVLKFIYRLCPVSEHAKKGL